MEYLQRGGLLMEHLQEAGVLMKFEEEALGCQLPGWSRPMLLRKGYGVHIRIFFIVSEKPC
tara:strand:+ start:296 stop:478 length:183 start_codon:yes stop_codon:yes gene_type:complete